MLRRHELLAAAGAAGGGGGGWNPGLLTDPDVAAWYRMLPGALTEDSSGNNNTLTNVNGAVGCTALGESLGCIDLEHDSGQYLYISDADLSDNFPLKNGSGNNKISVCFWMKPESSAYWHGLLSKTESSTNKKSFSTFFNPTNNRIILEIGYNGGASGEIICTFGAGFTDGKLYHVGITYDGDTKFGRIRIWDVEANDLLDADATGTGIQDINIEDADFGIAKGTHPFDGQMADIVVACKVFTPDEIDQIRDGTYGT